MNWDIPNDDGDDEMMAAHKQQLGWKRGCWCLVLLLVIIGALLLSFPLSQVQSTILDKDQGGRSVLGYQIVFVWD